MTSQQDIKMKSKSYVVPEGIPDDPDTEESEEEILPEEEAPKPEEQPVEELTPVEIEEIVEKRRRSIDIARIPGVRRILLSELSQRIINCVAGEDVNSERPWKYVKKELVEDNLELHEESSEFLPVKNEIMTFPKNEILIGLIPTEGGEFDDFFICVTEAATEAVETVIEERRLKLEAKLQNAINKTVGVWQTLGSEEEVNEGIPRTSRPLLQIEVVSKYPVLPAKVQLRLRTAEKARDGYMEFVSKDESALHVACKRIDNETQVTPTYRINEAQTICTYPSNKGTQYEFVIDIDGESFQSFVQDVLEYLKQNAEDMLNILYINRNINLYVDDYHSLVSKLVAKKTLLWLNFIEYMSFNDVNFCKGKMISCAHWHRMLTGIVAISYADLALNIFLPEPPTVDEVHQAVHGTNPVLLWSFIDPLNPRLILESHREITAVATCPFNENIVIGGAVNGQVIIWDITNRLQKVENQEILSNAQARYRSYMRALMGWMKDIHDIKVVRATAVSDLRYSHAGAVVRIQWISPFDEIGRTGKPTQFSEESEERSLQFMTAGDDGKVMIWDLLKKPTVTGTGYREKPLKRLKQRPGGLSSDVSPFRVLHLNFKPIYCINIVHPTQPRLLGISMLGYEKVEIEYNTTESIPNMRQSISRRNTYKANPLKSKPDLISKLLIGTMEGDFARAQWEGRDFDLGAVVNSENCTYTEFHKFHDGPVISIARHNLGGPILTTGGKVFAVWSDDLPDRPVFWRRCKSYYTHGSWYRFFPNRFRLLRSDGVYEVWCITKSSKKPSHLIPMSSGQLISANVHPRELKFFCVGISDALGNFRIFYLPREDSDKLKHAIVELNINDYIDQEVKRKKDFLKWQKDWCTRYVKVEEPVFNVEKQESDAQVQPEEVDTTENQEEQKRKVRFEGDAEDQKLVRPVGAKYDEWIKKQELAKEQERIKQMILEKKGLDTDELERQRKPLLKLEEENEVRRKKQKARIKGSETLFQETVAMLFPAIVKEKPAPPPSPYAGGAPENEKKICYDDFNEVAEQAQRYMRNTTLDLEFSWKIVLKEGRGRRKYLDNTFSRATHHERYASYKAARIAITAVNEAPSIPSSVGSMEGESHDEVLTEEVLLEEQQTEAVEVGEKEQIIAEEVAVDEVAVEVAAEEVAPAPEVAAEGVAVEVVAEVAPEVAVEEVAAEVVAEEVASEVAAEEVAES